MLFIFVKNNINQQVAGDLKDDKFHFIRPGSCDDYALIMDVCDKNSSGTTDSVITAKSEPLSLTSKNFNHNTHDLNRFFSRRIWK